MVGQRLRQIKREIRVLGVAVKQSSSGFIIVGVVYRGSLWLDGVLFAHSEEADITEAISQMLFGSPHSGQVRVILLSKDNLPSEVRFYPKELNEKTGKPIIFLGDTAETTSNWSNGYEKTTFSAIGLGRWSAEGVLRASTRQGVTPEALRVAILTLSVLPNE